MPVNLRSLDEPNGADFEEIPELKEVESSQTATDLVNPVTGTDFGSLDYWLKKTISLANEGDAGAIERLFNYYASKDSEKTALEWTAKREDTAYQRLVEDLRKAGISPYVLSSAGPAVSSYGGKSYSGSNITSSLNNARSNNTDVATNVLTGLFKVIGTALMFALMSAL